MQVTLDGLCALAKLNSEADELLSLLTSSAHPNSSTPLNVIVAGHRSLVVVGQISIAREMVKAQELEMLAGDLHNVSLERSVFVYKVSDDALAQVAQSLSPGNVENLLL